jgi:hypothetical protein
VIADGLASWPCSTAVRQRREAFGRATHSPRTGTFAPLERECAGSRIESVVRAALVVGVLAIAVAVAVDLVGRVGRGDARKTALRAAAAGNYRVLTPAQSRLLMSYSQTVYECVKTAGFPIGTPEPARTRIVMRLKGDAHANVQALMACDREVGPPPPRASLQARDGMIVLYLPRRCLLDEHVTA